MLRRLAGGSLSLPDAARALGTTEARAAELLEVYELTRELVPARPLLGGSKRGLALLVAASALLGAVGATAASSACPNGYQYCFVADRPARAGEINYNFSQAKEWIEAKVGTVANGTPGTATITNTSGSLDFGATTRQMINLWQTGYGIGVQNGTAYFRSVGAYAWYQGGTHANTQWDSGGGAVLMTLNSSGGLGVAQDLGVGANTWGAGPSNLHATPSVAPNFGNANVWTSTDCPNGQFVCGLLVGHIGGDAQYWTGARISLRCCTL